LIVGDEVNSGQPLFCRSNGRQRRVVDMQPRPNSVATTDNRELFASYLLGRITVRTKPSSRTVEKAIPHNNPFDVRAIEQTTFDLTDDTDIGSNRRRSVECQRGAFVGQASAGLAPERNRLPQVTSHTGGTRRREHICAPLQPKALIEGSSGPHRVAGVGFGKRRELFNHDFRPSTTQRRTQRVSVENIGDDRFDAFFDERLSLFGRARERDHVVSSGE
jgi:hypothetical protein